MVTGERILERLVRYFRRRRMRRFEERFGVTAATRILDIGGTAYNWRFLRARPQVTLVNLPRDVAPPPAPNLRFVVGDGCRLPFRDHCFDIVFSNSVIEHVGDAGRQRAFAREVVRVGRRYWIQTPDRRFPVEPHLFTPLLHFLPRRWQRWVARRFTVWALLVRPSPDRWKFYIDHYLNEIRLLDAAALRRLFPGARLRRERLCGWSKSLIAEKVTPGRGTPPPGPRGTGSPPPAPPRPGLRPPAPAPRRS